MNGRQRTLTDFHCRSRRNRDRSGSIGFRHERPTLLTSGQFRDIRVDVAFDLLDVVSGPASGVFSTDASVSVVTDFSFCSAVVLIYIRPI